jgi:AMP-polyphosphate phosphotransferase
MLELVDLDKRLDKDVYLRVFPQLEIRLGQCQRAAREAGVPVIVVFEGWHAAGKGMIINRLAQSLDPRGSHVYPIFPANEEERLHPWMWRFWEKTPAAGQFAIFDHSWYMRVLQERIDGAISRRRWEAAYDEIQQFERQLADAGTVIVKFWLHIDKKEQKRRFEKMRETPATAWKVGKPQRRQYRKHDKWLRAVEEMLQRTDTAEAPWTIVEAAHGRFSRVKCFETIVAAAENELHRRRENPPPRPAPMPPPEQSATAEITVLDRLDLGLSLEREPYEKELQRLQRKLFRLEHELYMARIPAVIVYEGIDAGGKGGNIKRLTRGLDPRGYEVDPVASPNAEEKAHHYLWRFWRNAPKAGHITIFDRSWYGRVLVERVEGFCSEADWRRAFQEINEFERQLAEFGTVIVKFWLQISQEEQLTRFEARKNTSEKQWKITDEDWRNREKWIEYKTAVVEMLDRTSTTYAPWTILEANCKLYARIKSLRTIADALENALERRK